MGLLKGGRGRLIEVTITACVWAKIRDFKNWPLNRGWPLNTGPLYTGSTVLVNSDKLFQHRKMSNLMLQKKREMIIMLAVLFLEKS